MRVSKQEKENLISFLEHVQRAKEELERMNVGKAHDEIVAALSNEFVLYTEDE